MTLTEFLLARIAEDEAVARRGEGAIVFKSDTFGDVDFRSGADKSLLRLSQRHLADLDDSSLAMLEGMVRWLPARVLAECAAKRAIVAQAEEASGDRASVVSEFCVGKAESDAAYATDPGDLILKALAAVYADHPDCDEAWRPFPRSL